MRAAGKVPGRTQPWEQELFSEIFLLSQLRGGGVGVKPGESTRKGSSKKKYLIPQGGWSCGLICPLSTLFVTTQKKRKKKKRLPLVCFGVRLCKEGSPWKEGTRSSRSWGSAESRVC